MKRVILLSNRKFIRFWLVLVVMPVLLLSIFSHTVFAEIDFVETFTNSNGVALQDHSSDWQVETGHPEIQNNTLYAPDTSQIILPNKFFVDGCVASDVLFPLTSLVYLEARVQGDNGANNIYSYIGPTELGNGIFVGSQTYYGSSEFLTGNLPKFTGWHKYKVCVINDLVTVFVDNKLILSYFDVLSEYLHGEGTGRVHFGAGDYIDNFSFEPLKAQVPHIAITNESTTDHAYSAAITITDMDSVRVKTTVDYGDGSDTQQLGEMRIPQTFQVHHIYSSAGTYEVVVTAVDTYGNVQVTSSRVTITLPSHTPVPTSKPTITVTPKPTAAPAINTKLAILFPFDSMKVFQHKNLPIIAGVISKQKIKKIEFYINGKLICTDSKLFYFCNWKVPKGKNILYQVLVKAYDSMGNISSSKSITVRSW